MTSVASDLKTPKSPVSKNPCPSKGRKMGIISPPSRKGMVELDKGAFDKDFKIPTVYVFEDSITPQTLQTFKTFLLKIQGKKPVSGGDSNGDKQTSESNEENTPARKIKKIFINPELVKGDFTQFVQQNIQPEPSIVSSVGYETVKLTYENWTLVQIMESVLPDEEDKVSGFSQIGHIVHVNLRDHVLPYKKLIGQVFLDKVSNAKTVVNKINVIESTYRNFQMEVLAGDPKTIVTVKENRCEFEFDFATVYWNPRLSSEHDRMVKVLEPYEILYDVFAGVGPFTIPAAKRKVNVIANDLNPDSFKWLQHNVNKNKVGSLVKCFNLDGRDFIKEAAPLDIEERISTEEWETTMSISPKRIHFVMNLPAIAVEFLDAFWGILSKVKDKSLVEKQTFMVHVYCFIKDVDGFKEKAVKLVKGCLGYDLPEKNISQVVFVRNVAPNKEMLRVSFILPAEVLLDDKNKAVKRKFCEIDEKNESKTD